MPAAKRTPVSRPAPKLGGYQELIDSWLAGDRDAPRKQRHTAKRIWERLRDEHAADVAERTVREYVHRRRRERGEGVQAFVPQVHEAGVEGEVDWGEAQVLRGRLREEGLPVAHACLPFGCGALCAAILIGQTAGAERFASDAQFARMAGVAPLLASSGRRDRHRLSRGGNRQLNRALHVIAITRGRIDPATRAYLARKEAEGKSRIEAMRCLKRHLARHYHQLLLRPAGYVTSRP